MNSRQGIALRLDFLTPDLRAPAALNFAITALLAGCCQTRRNRLLTCAAQLQSRDGEGAVRPSVFPHPLGVAQAPFENEDGAQ